MRSCLLKKQWPTQLRILQSTNKTIKAAIGFGFGIMMLNIGIIQIWIVKWSTMCVSPRPALSNTNRLQNSVSRGRRFHQFRAVSQDDLEAQAQWLAHDPPPDRLMGSSMSKTPQKQRYRDVAAEWQVLGLGTHTVRSKPRDLLSRFTGS
jgi:hypothetical protein